MNIGLHQIQQAQQRRSSRDRIPSTRSRDAAVAAFRNHQRNGNNNQLPTAPSPAAAQLPPPAAQPPAAVQPPPLPPPELPAVENPPQHQHVAFEDVNGGGGSDDDSDSVRAAMRDIDSPYGSAIDNSINQYGANEDRNGTDYSFETGAGELDYAAEEYSVHERVMYYLAGNLICNSIQSITCSKGSSSTRPNRTLPKIRPKLFPCRSSWCKITRRHSLP